MFIPLLCSLCYRLPVPAGREADEGRNRCTLGNSRRDGVLYDSFLGTAFQSLILYNTEGWINIPHAHAHANTHHTHIQTHITHTFQYLHNTHTNPRELLSLHYGKLSDFTHETYGDSTQILFWIKYFLSHASYQCMKWGYLPTHSLNTYEPLIIRSTSIIIHLLPAFVAYPATSCQLRLRLLLLVP